MTVGRYAFLSCALWLAACGGVAGVRTDDGSLPDCGSSPNCVSSTATDPERQVEPLRYTGSREAAQMAMAKLIGRMRGGAVVENEPGYMRAEFTSAVFQFVDDVEFRFRDDRVIDVRSGSRTGYYDLGVNRSRVEELRRAFDAIQP